tara:strand:+ start:512 stop:688 length:177 start_codon:yes stop_codon:yes gene_type:complete
MECFSEKDDRIIELELQLKSKERELEKAKVIIKELCFKITSGGQVQVIKAKDKITELS